MPYPENSDAEIVFTASHLLSTMRNGAANERATEELEKLVQAVQATDKSGSVTIKIKVSKLKGGETELKVDMTVSSSIPVGDIPFGIYYPDKDGSLHRTDPRQMELLDHKQRQDGDVNRVGRGPVIDGNVERIR
jgi:hypothetical protein